MPRVAARMFPQITGGQCIRCNSNSTSTRFLINLLTSSLTDVIAASEILAQVRRVCGYASAAAITLHK